MSLVVSSGWKTPFTKMEEVIDWANTVRPEMKKLSDAKLSKMISHQCCSLVTIMYNSPGFIPAHIPIMHSKWVKNYPLDPNYDFAFQIEGAYSIAIPYVKVSMEKDPWNDFRAEMVFIPWDGVIYANWYGDDRDFEKLATKDFTSFWYDGRTDGGDEVPWKEYEARGKVWSDIFDKYDNSASAGVIVDLLPQTWMSSSMRLRIDEEYRKKIIKNDVVESKLYKEWLEVNKEWAELSIKEHGPFSVFDKFRDWVKGEGSQRRDEVEIYHLNKFPSVDRLNAYLDMKPADVMAELRDNNGGS